MDASGRLTWGRPTSPAMQSRLIACARTRTSSSSCGESTRGATRGEVGSTKIKSPPPRTERTRSMIPSLRSRPASACSLVTCGRPLDPLADARSELRACLPNPFAVIGPDFPGLDDTESLVPFPQAFRTDGDFVYLSELATNLVNGRAQGLRHGRVQEFEGVFGQQQAVGKRHRAVGRGGRWQERPPNFSETRPGLWRTTPLRRSSR